MREKLLFTLLFAMAAIGCSKSSNNFTQMDAIPAAQVPSPVMSAYTTRYPAATGQVEWEKEDGNTYKVKFFPDAQRWQAIFMADGTFLSEKQL